MLSDPEKRKKYDQYGKDWEHGEAYQKAGHATQSKAANTGERHFSGDFGEGDFSDFFGSMFGATQGGTNRVKFRGQDFNSELHLTLKEAYSTHQQTFNVNGKNIRITISSGIENGQTIKITGHGGKGMQGGPNGDLYITFSIRNTSQFKRVGNDLYTTLDIDLFTAVLGGEVMLEMLDGKIKLKVLPETQNGAKIRLKGKGFPIYKKEGEFGYLYVTYHLKMPINLNEKQKQLFSELAELSK